MLTRADSDSDRAMRARATAIAKAGGLEQALAKELPKIAECSLSEALVLGLLKQGVRKYFARATRSSASASRWRWRMPPQYCVGNTENSRR